MTLRYRVSLVVVAFLAMARFSALAQFTQQGPKLVGTGSAGTRVFQGQAVALSADGNTAIVGGILDQGGVGAAWVWTKNGGVWTQQGGKLIGSSSPTGLVYQGWSVALSADGNTAIVGGPTDGSNQNQPGAAWVWTRSAALGWTQQAKLVGSGAIGASRQGSSVALSADGNTAIVGAHYDNYGVGAAWVWTRSGGVWSQQGNKLIGTGVVFCAGQSCTGGARQGVSVALSDDGNTAIIGGSGDNPFIPTGVSGFYLTSGTAWVWTRSGGVWTQQGDKLVGSGNYSDYSTGTYNQGDAVALAGDGNTAIIGGSGGPGASWIWTRNGSSWTERARLTQLNVRGQGSSVSLSSDGNTAMVGGYLGADATWIWTKSGGAWSDQGIRLVESGVVGAPSFQFRSARMSADGNTVIVGEGADNDGVGAAWVFVSNQPRRRAMRR